MVNRSNNRKIKLEKVFHTERFQHIKIELGLTEGREHKTEEGDVISGGNYTGIQVTDYKAKQRHDENKMIKRMYEIHNGGKVCKQLGVDPKFVLSAPLRGPLPNR